MGDHEYNRPFPVPMSGERIGQIALMYAKKVALDKTLQGGNRPAEGDLALMAHELEEELAISLEEATEFLKEVYRM